MNNYDDLRKAAEAAKAVAHPHATSWASALELAPRVIMEAFLPEGVKFIALASPEAIIKLLNECDSLRKKGIDANKLLDRAAQAIAQTRGSETHVEELNAIVKLQGTLALETNEELERLRARNEKLEEFLDEVWCETAVDEDWRKELQSERTKEDK